MPEQSHNGSEPASFEGHMAKQILAKGDHPATESQVLRTWVPDEQWNKNHERRHGKLQQRSKPGATEAFENLFNK